MLAPLCPPVAARSRVSLLPGWTSGYVRHLCYTWQSPPPNVWIEHKKTWAARRPDSQPQTLNPKHTPIVPATCLVHADPLPHHTQAGRNKAGFGRCRHPLADTPDKARKRSHDRDTHVGELRRTKDALNRIARRDMRRQLLPQAVSFPLCVTASHGVRTSASQQGCTQTHAKECGPASQSACKQVMNAHARKYACTSSILTPALNLTEVSHIILACRSARARPVQSGHQLQPKP